MPVAPAQMQFIKTENCLTGNVPIKNNSALKMITTSNFLVFTAKHLQSLTCMDDALLI